MNPPKIDKTESAKWIKKERDELKKRNLRGIRSLVKHFQERLSREAPCTDAELAALVESMIPPAPLGPWGDPDIFFPPSPPNYGTLYNGLIGLVIFASGREIPTAMKDYAEGAEALASDLAHGGNGLLLDYLSLPGMGRARRRPSGVEMEMTAHPTLEDDCSIKATSDARLVLLAAESVSAMKKWTTTRSNFAKWLLKYVRVTELLPNPPVATMDGIQYWLGGQYDHSWTVEQRRFFADVKTQNQMVTIIRREMSKILEEMASTQQRIRKKQVPKKAGANLPD